MPAERSDQTRTASTVAGRTHVSFDELAARISDLLVDAGASPAVAEVIGRNCAACERDGAHSHGVFRVPGYVSSLRSGHVDGSAEPVLDVSAPALLRIDAANGFAQPAVAAARAEIDRMLEVSGAAIVAMRRSHHFSALWPDIEPFARAGYVAITMVVGGTPTVKPRGVTDPVYGTNPFAFATPVAGADPVVADFATSAMSHGDLQLARNSGREVPTGTGTGRGGRETADPAEIIAERGLLPFGGHKGAALSFMVEVLASALTGGAFSLDEQKGLPREAVTRSTGQLFILIDPARGATTDFGGRVADLIGMLHAAGLDRLPGDARYRTRARAETDGIPVTPAVAALFT